MTPEQYDLVEAIFIAACELPPARHPTFLDERCGGDPIVRSAVEAMLAADEEGGSDGLSSPALPATAGTRVLDEDTLRRERSIPERIEHYRIIRECGHGGMGVVYEAEQDSPKRRVALKVVRSGVVSRELLRRFRHEAEVLGRLQHPGIGQIFEAGSFDVGEGGQPYFAMEYIEGVSVTEHAATHDLDVKGRLALFLRVCEAVHYAHQMGVIHRDLKPDNVLVDPQGQPKVLDFGIARMTDSDVQMTTMRTDMGRLIGTIQYMSPEQTSGDSRELDTRSDVYALGVMLFELLGERLPHDLRNRSIPESVLVIRQDDPKRLSSVSATFRGDLDTIVGKCLEKEPDRRYQSASELAEDIRRYLRDEPISARPPSAMYQLRKFARRNRALVGGTIATILTLVAGVIGMALFSVQSGRNAQAARAQAYRAEIVAAQGLIETDPAGARIRLENAPPEFRNWEWQYLMHRLAGELDDLVVGGPIVGRPAQATDGSVLAVRADGVVVRWEGGRPESRTTVAEFGVSVRDWYQQRPSPVAFSAGAQRVAVLTTDDDVRAHDLATNTPLDVPPLPGGAGDAAIAWDAGGERLIAARLDSFSTWNPGDDWTVRPIDWPDDWRFDSTARYVDLQVVPGADRAVGLVRAGQWSAIVLLELSTGRVVANHQHEEGVGAMGVSPDGRQVAVGYGFRTVRLLNAETLEVISSPGAHLSSVLDVAFSPDGTLLCSVGGDDTIRLWDLAGQSPRPVLQADAPRHAMIASDGSLLLCLEATTGEDAAFAGADRIRRWSISDAGSTVLRGHESYVYDLLWSPDGARLASFTFAYKTSVWDARAGLLLRRFELGLPRVFRHDGTLVLDIGGRFVLADPATGAVEHGPPLARTALHHSKGHHNKFIVATDTRLPTEHAIWRTDYNATGEGAFILRAFADAKLLGQVPVGQGGLYRPGPIPHPLFIGNPTGDSSLRGFMAELIILNGRLSDGDAGAIERYLGQRRATGRGVWPEISSATLVARFVADASTVALDAEGRVSAWSATNDSRIVLRASTGGRGEIRLDETAMNGHPTLASAGHLEGVLPDDVRLGDTTVFWLGHYTTSETSDAYNIGLGGFLSPAYRHELRLITGQSLAGSRFFNVGAVSADGLAGVATYGGITLADDGAWRGRIPGLYLCMAFHPDGRHVAAGSQSGVIDIWDIETREKINELTGHQGIVYGVDYSPDGTRLVSGGNDTTVRLWDAASGAQVLELRGHAQYVKAVAFSPDGTQIASASGDKTVRIWNSVSREDSVERARPTREAARSGTIARDR